MPFFLVGVLLCSSCAQNLKIVTYHIYKPIFSFEKILISLILSQE